jgi:hypothetical protein
METARKWLEKSQVTQKMGYDKRLQTKSIRAFEVGEQILIREKAVMPGKFNYRFYGPFEITEKKSDYNYLVKSIEKPNRQQRVINVDRMKSWNKDGISKSKKTETAEVKSQEEGNNINNAVNQRYNFRPKINLPIRYRQKD